MLKFFRYILCFILVSSSTYAEEFYKNKTVTFIVGNQVGTNYDLYARLMAKHISKHIPGNPSTNVVNIVGAASKVATNHLVNVAPKDGTHIAITQTGSLLEPLYRNTKLNYDVLSLNYIGSMNVDKQICFVINSSKIKKFEDIYDKNLILGSTPPGSTPYEYSTMVKNIFPNKIKIVTGYIGLPDMYPALLRGEVEGVCGLSYGVAMNLWKPDFENGFFKILVQLDDEGVAGVKAPLITDFIKDKNTSNFVKYIIKQKEFSRTFIMSGEVPVDRLNIIRKAFYDAIRDEELIQDAKKIRLDLDYRDGIFLKNTIFSMYNLPKEELEQIVKLMNP